MSNDRQEQIDENYRAFAEMLPNLLTTHPGKFALIRDRKVIEFYDTARDAYVTGQKLYEDSSFSVQEVINTPVDLGYFSRAVPQPHV